MKMAAKGKKNPDFAVWSTTVLFDLTSTSTSQLLQTLNKNHEMTLGGVAVTSELLSCMVSFCAVTKSVNDLFIHCFHSFGQTLIHIELRS